MPRGLNLFKIIAFVLAILIIWIIITKPDTAAPFVAGMVKDVAVFLQVLFTALLALLRSIITLFQQANA